MVLSKYVGGSAVMLLLLKLGSAEACFVWCCLTEPQHRLGGKVPDATQDDSHRLCASIACIDMTQARLGSPQLQRTAIFASAAGHAAAAGTSAQSPITAQVLAAKQGMRRKSRLQQVTAAEDTASPSGEPQQATPRSGDRANRATSHQQRQGQTPGHPGASEDGGQTPRTAGGSAYMTPPTGSGQRPAVRDA